MISGLSREGTDYVGCNRFGLLLADYFAGMDLDLSDRPPSKAPGHSVEHLCLANPRFDLVIEATNAIGRRYDMR